MANLSIRANGFVDGTVDGSGHGIEVRFLTTVPYVAEKGAVQVMSPSTARDLLAKGLVELTGNVEHRAVHK